MNKSEKDRLWVEAAKRYHLSPAHVKMARELGMNPKKLGGIANHKQERWKAPLPEFIEDLHETRFRKKRPNGERPATPPVAANGKKAAAEDQTLTRGQQQTPAGQVSDGLEDLPF